MSKINYIKAAILQKFRKSEDKLLIVDIRSHDDYEKSRIPGSINIPMEQLSSRISLFEKYKNRVVFYCDNGKLSAVSANIMLNHVVQNFKVLAGGMKEWANKGFEVQSAFRVSSFS
jgi:rhodanese-related sulfurtransferase